MTKLSWDLPGERIYEIGVDRGVLYPPNREGVPWNGLISVTEAPTQTEPNPLYLDGVKFVEVPGRSEFAGTIEAYTYPGELEEFIGYENFEEGLSIGDQPRRPFGVSYRTLVGDDLETHDRAYKIHLVYNVLLSPSETLYSTLTDEPDPTTFSWPFTTTPIFVETGSRPTAHLIVRSDRMSPDNLEILESILYGGDDSDPRLPTPNEIFFLLGPGTYDILEDLETGLASLSSEGSRDLMVSDTPGLYIPTPTTRLVETSISGLYSLED